MKNLLLRFIYISFTLAGLSGLIYLTNLLMVDKKSRVEVSEPENVMDELNRSERIFLLKQKEDLERELAELLKLKNKPVTVVDRTDLNSKIREIEALKQANLKQVESNLQEKKQMDDLRKSIEELTKKANLDKEAYNKMISESKGDYNKLLLDYNNKLKEIDDLTRRIDLLNQSATSSVSPEDYSKMVKQYEESVITINGLNQRIEKLTQGDAVKVREQEFLKLNWMLPDLRKARRARPRSLN
jgi:hypothetical protein